jgi:putative phosphotransacetylase
MSVADAEQIGVKNGDIVKVSTPGERAVIFGNVVVRANDRFALDMHVDIDEANAAGLGLGAWGEVLVENTL